jgi:hypothetical protein
MLALKFEAIPVYGSSCSLLCGCVELLGGGGCPPWPSLGAVCSAWQSAGVICLLRCWRPLIFLPADRQRGPLSRVGSYDIVFHTRGAWDTEGHVQVFTVEH